MDTSEYNKIKQDILDLPVIYREVEPKEIVALGDNFYNIVNTEVYVDPGVAGKIDTFQANSERSSYKAKRDLTTCIFRLCRDVYG